MYTIRRWNALELTPPKSIVHSQEFPSVQDFCPLYSTCDGNSLEIPRKFHKFVNCSKFCPLKVSLKLPCTLKQCPTWKHSPFWLCKLLATSYLLLILSQALLLQNTTSLSKLVRLNYPTSGLVYTGTEVPTTLAFHKLEIKYAKTTVQLVAVCGASS